MGSLFSWYSGRMWAGKEHRMESPNTRLTHTSVWLRSSHFPSLAQQLLSAEMGEGAIISNPGGYGDGASETSVLQEAHWVMGLKQIQRPGWFRKFLRLSNIAVAPLVQMDPLVCGIIWYFGSLLGWNPWFNSEFTSADHRTTIGIAWLMPNVDSKRYSCILSLSAQTEFTWELARFLFCFICTSGPSTTFWHL